jgi:prophage regulatory protein
MGLIDHNRIADMVGMNRAHVRDRLTKRPDFPRPFVIGGARRWREEEITEWIEAQRQAPDGRRTRGLSASPCTISAP